MAKSATAVRDGKQSGNPPKAEKVKAIDKASKPAIKPAGQAGGGLAALGSDNAVTGMVARSIDFLKDVRSELRKVVTPSKEEVRSMTTVVIITVFAIAAYFWVVDAILGHVVQSILHFLGSTQ